MIYHRYDENGVKYLQSLTLDTTPTDNIGYTYWKRGYGETFKVTYKPKSFIDNRKPLLKSSEKNKRRKRT